MKNSIIKLFNFLKQTFITQDFMPKGCLHIFSIPFIPCCIYMKDFRPLIGYHGQEWRHKRDEFSLKLHGMTWEEAHRPENAHLFVARPCNSHC